jgi:hypothetical protein
MALYRYRGKSGKWQVTSFETPEEEGGAWMEHGYCVRCCVGPVCVVCSLQDCIILVHLAVSCVCYRISAAKEQQRSHKRDKRGLLDMLSSGGSLAICYHFCLHRTVLRELSEASEASEHLKHIQPLSYDDMTPLCVFVCMWLTKDKR